MLKPAPRNHDCTAFTSACDGANCWRNCAHSLFERGALLSRPNDRDQEFNQRLHEPMDDALDEFELMRIVAHLTPEELPNGFARGAR